MAKTTYPEALRRVLMHEGGYTDHPSDPGGPTNFGITIHDYRKYVKPGATAADVRAMRLDEAKAIYKAKYWDALRCDELPPGVDYAVFDYGVNSGIGRSGKVLRRVLGLDAATWTVTDGVIAAAAARDPSFLVGAICAERLAFLQRLSTWPTFGKGWGRRVAEVRSIGQTMARRTDPAEEASASSIPAPGKGELPNPTKGQAGAAGGAVVAGGTAAQQAHEAGLRPWAIALIVVVTLALAVGSAVYLKVRRDRLQEA